MPEPEKQAFSQASSVISVSDMTLNTASSQQREDSMVSPPYQHDRESTTKAEKQVHHAPDEKEAVTFPPPYYPSSNTDSDKQVFSHTTDSSKEVTSNLTSQNTDTDVDTSKIYVPQHEPISMDKEVAPSSAAQAIISPDYKDLTSSSSSTGQGNSILVAFRLEKKHALGLILYQNQQIAVHPIDLTNNQHQSPAFMTSSMAFIEAMTGQPPMFELFGYTSPPTPAGRWIPLGLEGIFRMRGEVDVVIPVPPDHASGQHMPSSRTEKWEMKRKGVLWPGRQYDMWRQSPENSSNDSKRSADVAWKGSTRTVRDVIKKNNLTNLQTEGKDGESTKHGSLKLIDPNSASGDVLALWNQWRGGDTLGDLLIFRTALGKISVEAIVVSVIAVVHAERITGMHWVGGMGK